MMKVISKYAVFVLLLSFTSLQANFFKEINPIMWNWIAVITLSILFFILFYSLLRDIKNTKKEINDIFSKQNENNLSKYNHFNDIYSNEDEVNNTLKESIQKLYSNSSDKIILENLLKVYKNVFLSNKEEEIFISIAKGEKIGKTECFKLSDLLNELYKHNIINSSEYPSTQKYIVANREILSDIFLLLNRLQTKEHNLKKVKFDIFLDSQRNNLTITVDKKLKLNTKIKKVLEKKIEPVFDSLDEIYWGIYLYLLKHLTNMLNATLRINLSDNHYTITIHIPVDVKHQINDSGEALLILKEPKRALIVGNRKRGKEIVKKLNELNFICDTIEIRELNKELPNFIEYDIAFIYSKIFEPILTDYLRTIKTYSPLKLIAMVDGKNSLYPAKIVDTVLNLDNADEELYSTILELYKENMVLRDSIEIKKEEVSKEKREIKKAGRVLIADDDIANLHILDYMFKKYGIKTVTVTNGEDALKYLDKEKFDLVILDSIMPKMNGYETIVKIRENPKFNSIPIIIHTSFSIEESSMDKIFKLGFDSYLPKPFNKYDFKSLIERYIPVYSEPETLLKRKSKTNKDDLKEFIAIYSDSDKMLNRYLKENREEQAVALLDDLRDIAIKIDANELLNLIDNIEEHLKIKHEVDSVLMYKLSNNLNKLKKDIIKKLSA